MFVQIEDEVVNADHILRYKAMGGSIVFYLVSGKTINWDFPKPEQLTMALKRTANVLNVQKLG